MSPCGSPSTWFLKPRAIPDAVARSGSRYINYVRGAESHLSFTALGGAPIVMATLYLLWSYRAVGGLGRLLVAAGVPVVWFSLLAIVTPDVTAGPLATFSRGSLHGLFWLVLAAFVGVALPKGRAGPGSAAQRGSSGASRSRIFGGSRSALFRWRRRVLRRRWPGYASSARP